MLRSDQWFPRRAALALRIAPPIRAEGADFSAALQLRDAVRGVILKGCGEPDLNELAKPGRA